jgi:enolase
LTVIAEVATRKILDSRGNPTVEVDIFVKGGFGRCSAPSGASTGANEVRAFPEKGVDYAIENFKENVAPKLIGMDAAEQENLDGFLRELDGTDDFSNIGGNVSVAVSLANARAAASTLDIPLYRYLNETDKYSLPLPLGNVLGGGKHAVRGTDIQEYMAVSFGYTVSQNIFANSKVHSSVKKSLKEKFPKSAIGKGDEGAWVAQMDDEDALKLVFEACNMVFHSLDIEVKPCLDLAASEFFYEGKYNYKNQVLNVDEQIGFIIGLIENYGLYSVEDPLDQEDFDGYAKLTRSVGDRCIIVGDDIFVTNKARVEKGINMGAANAVLIKPNQIGTLTGAIETIKFAHKNGYKTIVSHRSGETNDNSIAHLAVAFGCHGIKTGTVGGERTAKLNELVRIEEEITKSEG